MSKVVCPSVECKYCNDAHICTAKQVNLTYRNMATVNEGRVDMWICNQYEPDDEYRELEKNLEEFMKTKIRRNN
ncbi:MAG: hypothetical protein J5725_03170 [Bacteroidales bacterium]|nr:hypothetical protein [Bacteroidales bacterium]